MSKKIEFIGNYDLSGRDLFFLGLDSVEETPKEIKLTSEHFACLIAWDSENASVEQISKLVETIILNGAGYICCWGKGCQRVHDIADEIDSYPYKLYGSPDGSVIMTTWHEDESLEEVMWFFLNVTNPDTYYEKSLNSNLVISIGNKTWDESILKLLQNPDSLRI
jgi:hypothetical protein